jgi:hypothetical protein
MKPTNPTSPRRHFLLGATLGTAATAAAIVTGKSTAVVEAEVVAGAKPVEEPTGYRMTPRIAQYYETTKI